MNEAERVHLAGLTAQLVELTRQFKYLNDEIGNLIVALDALAAARR